MTSPETKKVLSSGDLTAVFERDDKGWRPDWFYEGDTPVLRFKDHEWLSLGRVVCVTHASELTEEGESLVFSGTEDILGVTTRWRVSVTPAGDGFFRVLSEILPEEGIELVEALTSFETPYLYDGSEKSTTIIGANPSTIWEGTRQVTPKIWDNPEWCYSRSEAARVTYDSHLPVLVHRVVAADGSSPIHTSICANFDACDYHDLYTTPTRTTDPASGDYSNLKRADRRGYKFIAGAVNWASAYVKDPNIYVPPEGTGQELLVSASSSMPGGSLDEWLMRCWERSYEQHNDGRRLPVMSAVGRTGADWRKAGAWLQKAFIHPGATDMVHPEMGPQDYVRGTRPIAHWCYGPGWRHYLDRNLLAVLRYRTQVQGQDGETRALDAFEQDRADKMEERDLAQGGDDRFPRTKLSIVSLAALTPDSPIARLATKYRLTVDMASAFEAAKSDPDSTPGIVVRTIARFAPLMDRESFDPLWRPMLGHVERDFEEHFHEFSYQPRRKLHINGGQSAVSVFLGAATLFGRACSITDNEHYARMWARMINMAIGWGYHTYNGDEAEDFDWRGAAHGSLSGRDQRADVPPMENAALMWAMGWLDIIPEHLYKRSWFDCLWLASQTGLSQYPAARTTKRLWTPRYGREVVSADKVATERYFKAHFPYMAYEDPCAQTMLATYQSLAGFWADMFMGGLLADAGPDVLCLVPRTARMDLRELDERLVVLYNPRTLPAEATLTVKFGENQSKHSVHLGGREWRKVRVRTGSGRGPEVIPG